MPIRFVAVLLLLVTACSSTKTTRLAPDSLHIGSIAILPASSKTEVARERIEGIHGALVRELRSSGFNVLSPVVTRNCAPEGCQNARSIADKYGIDAFLSVSVDDISQTNVLAAFHNAITGTVKALSPDGAELMSVTRTESERGGLLFDSGQVFEAVEATADNSRDSSFNRLALKFAQSVALELPKPELVQSTRAASGIKIDNVTTTSLGSGRYRLCAHGTAGYKAALLVGRSRADLREGAEGMYCGVFPLGAALTAENELVAELRSPYGVAVQKRVDGSSLVGCDVEDVVAIDDGMLALHCSTGDSACSEKLAQCKEKRLIVYRAQSASGPFIRQGELPGNSRADASLVYAVLPIAKDGGASTPVTLIQKEGVK